jgi:hypothetical protein
MQALHSDSHSRPSMDSVPALPVPPGKSPFHIKGVVMQGVLAYLAKKCPGGVEIVFNKIEDPLVQAFYRQQFLAASWYDFLPFLHFAAAAGAAMRVSTARFVAEHAAWQAERDVRGIHRLLLMLASPEKVAERLGVAFARYFDFATVEVSKVATGMSDVVVRGLPAIVLPWYKVSVHAAAQSILSLAGARNFEATYSTIEAAGHKAGIPLINFTVHRTWTR